ncbi:hypothetical protein BDN72DRAFT_896837 [Pluteus cervinus]|uniref:Uncharacterized protein n=1 Tax=Pluteus cervinus TaxID=181527 RepID=A0ACD3AX60_9AGAR|nr:hypothetical protein BDN72DRAFT_896837 [Pluteus cervinus]
MARDTNQTLLSSTTPTAIARAKLHIGHVQLRDLIICPRERGIVNYVQHKAIVEHNILAPDSAPRQLAELQFVPNTLTSLQIEGTDETLLAAGGQEAEVHLSMHAPSSSPHRSPRMLWQYETRLQGSINNSVLLTSLSLNRSNESSPEPRIAISNNDCYVRFYDIPIRANSTKRHPIHVGEVELDVPVNHSSISPDGRTLLSVGDSSKVYLHQISGGSRLNFSPIMNLTLPPSDISPLMTYSSNLAASFSSAFNSDGTKFVVASQEGSVVVWDVRSTKPMKVYQTNKTRPPTGGNGGATGWLNLNLSDDPWEWTRGNSKAPGWSVRSVKFGYGGSRHSGKEIMAFTEHTSYAHVVDARTWDAPEMIRVPTAPGTAIPPIARRPQPPSHDRPQLPRRPPTITFRPHRYLNATRPSPHLSASERQQAMVQVLEDTFHIPGTGTPSRVGAGGRPTSAESWGYPRDDERGDEAEDPGLLVIPRLGDRHVESEVQALLGRYQQLRQRQMMGGPQPPPPPRPQRLPRSRLRRHPEDMDDLDDQEGDVEDELVDPNTGSNHGDYDYNPPMTTSVAAHNTFVGSGGGANGRIPRIRPPRTLFPIAGTGSSSAMNPGGVGGDDDMEVDELESDCASSRTPSRSSSPSPPSLVPVIPSSVPGGTESVGRLTSPPPVVGFGWNGSGLSPASAYRQWHSGSAASPSWRSSSSTASGSGSTSGNATGGWTNSVGGSSSSTAAVAGSYYTSPPPPSHFTSSGYAPAMLHGSSGYGKKTTEAVSTYEDDLDLAGLCFDPSGGHMYIASTEGVAEWGMRGREKNWWTEGRWA